MYTGTIPSRPWRQRRRQLACLAWTVLFRADKARLPARSAWALRAASVRIRALCCAVLCAVLCCCWIRTLRCAVRCCASLRRRAVAVPFSAAVSRRQQQLLAISPAGTCLGLGCWAGLGLDGCPAALRESDEPGSETDWRNAFMPRRWAPTAPPLRSRPRMTRPPQNGPPPFLFLSRAAAPPHAPAAFGLSAQETQHAHHATTATATTTATTTATATLSRRPARPRKRPRRARVLARRSQIL